MFISFEGIDGCGKSTQVRMLQETLEREGRRVLVVREPGHTPIAEHIRAILLDKKNTMMTATTELLLFFASRAELVETVIKPALREGLTVICDRYVDSSIAYQGYGRQLPLLHIEYCTAVATGGLLPDVTFFLDLPLSEAKVRWGRAEADRIESSSDDFFERVIIGYRELVRQNPGRIVHLQATTNAETLAAEIYAQVQKRITTGDTINQ